MRLTKRILAAVMSVLMIVTSANIVVLAADEKPTITVSSATGRAGETVDVAVSIENNPGIVSAMLDVEYDKDVLTLKEVKDGGLFVVGDVEAELWHSDNLMGNPYRLSWAGDTLPSNTERNGVMAVLTFEIADDVEGEYPIKITVPEEGQILNFAGDVVDFEMVGENVTIISEDAPAIVVGSAKGRAGDTVEVTISLENNPGIASVNLNIEYGEYLTLVEATDHEIIPGFMGNTLVTQKLTWWNFNLSDNVTANDEIATLKFEISEDAPVDAQIEVSVSYDSAKKDITDVGGELVEFNIISEYVTVIDTIYGDVDEDTIVTLWDATVVARHAAGWPDYSADTLDMDAADVDMDGVVTLWDATIIARHAAGWPDYSELPYVEE